MKTLLIDVDEPFCPQESGELTVEAGVVWLTESGNSNDLFLRPGQQHAIVRSHRTIVQSLASGTRLRFEPAGCLAQVRDLGHALGDTLTSLLRPRPHLEN